MGIKEVIMKNSALSENTKMASLSQNLVRRMRNTYSRVPAKIRVDRYKKNKLYRSGYSKPRKRIIISGLKGYKIG